jgi:DNA-binding Lrp family transcriptional regulator
MQRQAAGLARKQELCKFCLMMHDLSIDGFDIAILNALQGDASLTNAQLSERVNLSASQCSRRRSALETNGLIAGYKAVLNAEALGFGLRAITRVSLAGQQENHDDAFSRFVETQPAVRAAYSVSGEADYILEIHVRDLPEFAEFIHKRLLPHPSVAQVRSEIVLKTMKELRLLPLN